MAALEALKASGLRLAQLSDLKDGGAAWLNGPLCSMDSEYRAVEWLRPDAALILQAEDIGNDVAQVVLFEDDIGHGRVRALQPNP